MRSALILFSPAVLLIANLENRALETFRSAGLEGLIGHDHFFWRVHDAVLAAAAGRVKVVPPPPPPSDAQIVDKWFEVAREKLGDCKDRVATRFPELRLKTGHDSSAAGVIDEDSVPPTASLKDATVLVAPQPQLSPRAPLLAGAVQARRGVGSAAGYGTLADSDSDADRQM